MAAIFRAGDAVESGPSSRAMGDRLVVELDEPGRRRALRDRIGEPGFVSGGRNIALAPTWVRPMPWPAMIMPSDLRFCASVVPLRDRRRWRRAVRT